MAIVRRFPKRDGYTWIDCFCGAGGSSKGVNDAGGEILAGINHWALALESYALNHPKAKTLYADISKSDPRWFPDSTFAWFSPECDWHTKARGSKDTGTRANARQLKLFEEGKIDPAAVRSRMTAWNVITTVEKKRVMGGVVENVPEFRDWELYDYWEAALVGLGYRVKVLYLNSQFFGVPQSRDRMYVVFWRTNAGKDPQLTFPVAAPCVRCQREVLAVQVWKKALKPHGGVYGIKNGQYVYVCPLCAAIVVPATVPASSIIDFSLYAARIADREAEGLKTLSENTLRRIRIGLKKFGFASALINGSWGANRAATPLSVPLPTQTTRDNRGVLLLRSSYGDGGAKVWDGNERPLPTQTARQDLSFVTIYNNRDSAIDSLADPLATVTSVRRHALLTTPPDGLLVPYNGTGTATSTDAPIGTITSVERFGFATVATAEAIPAADMDAAIDALVPECRYRMLEPEPEISAAMGLRDYQVVGKRRDRVVQYGNAVIPDLAQAIAERLRIWYETL